jgi:hypothetical protein
MGRFKGHVQFFENDDGSIGAVKHTPYCFRLLFPGFPDRFLSTAHCTIYRDFAVALKGQKPKAAGI